mmetsp:Transcript_53578/g.120820  ORF Transcript_53578/g.120820 Transcript_53578/m.120820 type:complete len:464 (+) Transcript_53578:60-1451(+)
MGRWIAGGVTRRATRGIGARIRALFTEGTLERPADVAPLPASSWSPSHGFRINGSKTAEQHPAGPAKYIDTRCMHGLWAASPAMRALEDAPLNVRSFSELSSAGAVRSVCHAKVPGWSSLPIQEIQVDQLCEGLSNQNFKVHVNIPNVTVSCVLFRAYGKDAKTLYDTDLELRTVQMLSKYQVAPRIYASGDGWRIEEWHFSVPLPNRSMRNPAIFAQVAAHFGRLHKLSSRDDFPRDFLTMPTLSSQRLSSWGDACRRAAERTPDMKQALAQSELDIEEIVAEREWLKTFLDEDAGGSHGAGLDKVFCHWDGQENNILQTHYGLRFIDFEYSGMEHQAFDIAHYFVECMIDYLHDAHPFYRLQPSSFPADWEQRLFCSIYLSEYLERSVRPDDAIVAELLGRVQRFVLVNHLLWTFWSVVRADQAPTFGGFDFVHYAQSRWYLYKWAKRGLLSEPRAPLPER